ncbi:MAG: hypothetical protein HKN23_00130 [Verrucomicrobiales bacterium]|nr:hypothetical protein [Verrucomicrobiales bacterium]
MNAIRLLSGLLPVLLLASCASARFEKDWKQALADEASGKSNAVTGPWTGTWETETNGHTGDLRCLVSEDGDSHKFRYHATWGKIFQGGYTANYDVRKTGRAYKVTGSKDLGFFGEFAHDGTIRGDTFHATYESSKGDKGAFLLRRP